MLKRDLAALGLGTNSEHERDAEEYWRDLEMPRSCAAEVGAPHGRSSRPGRVCRNATVPSALAEASNASIDIFQSRQPRQRINGDRVTKNLPHIAALCRSRTDSRYRVFL